MSESASVDRERITVLDGDLVKAAKSIKVLTHLDWPKETGARFLDGHARGDLRAPEVSYTTISLETERAALKSVMKRCDRSHPVEDFLHRTARSYDRVAEMIETRGTRRFGELSVAIYGSPADPVAVDQTTTLEAARHLMDSTASFAARCAHAEADFCVMPEAVAESLRKEVGFFRPHDVQVVVDPGLAAKAAAGALKIRIRGGSCFTSEDSAQLINHELFVHTLTALNGRMQPVLQSLGLGAPRTTRTQEGLALFAELITNSIDITRLRRIAARCVGIDMALNGADFVEVFRYFLDTGQTPGESFGSAQRVFRGGDVRGGVAFTKDGVYLQGFVRVHNFLRDAVVDGNFEALTRLVAGRLQTADVRRLDAHFDSGLIAEPSYVPPWLVRRSSLVAFLLYSSFTQELHIGAREASLAAESEEMPA